MDWVNQSISLVNLSNQFHISLHVLSRRIASLFSIRFQMKIQRRRVASWAQRKESSIDLLKIAIRCCTQTPTLPFRRNICLHCAIPTNDRFHRFINNEMMKDAVLNTQVHTATEFHMTRPFSGLVIWSLLSRFSLQYCICLFTLTFVVAVVVTNSNTNFIGFNMNGEFDSTNAMPKLI